MSHIHLWDNSWHVEKITDGPNDIKDSFGRKPLDLKKCGGDSTLQVLSSRTIGEWMQSEEDSVLVVPNSFQEGNDGLKDQYIFRVSAKNGTKIDSVTTNNIVGFIGKGNTDIRIHSRFSNQEGEVNDCFLYYMLGKVMAINFSNLQTSAFYKEPVFDFLLFFFPKLLKGAMSQGIYKKYVYNEYNDANIRGVIDVNRHIRRNIPANGRIAYRTREFSYDNPVTQLVRHTIEFIRCRPFGKSVLHNDPDTEACVQQIIQATPSFSTRQQQMVINENLRPIIHPYYTKYAALQNLCLSILRHERLSYESKTNNDKIHGILIDASWLWEEYLALVLAENGSNLKHYTQKDAPFYLFQKDLNKQFQQIIPDYYDGEKVVADAKYIPLHNSDHLSADRAAAVYYKTIMYMYRFNSDMGFLFHPCSPDDVKRIRNESDKFGHISTDNNMVFCDYEIVDRVNCHLYELGMVIPTVGETVSKYSDFKKEMKEVVERAFASQIDNTISRHNQPKQSSFTHRG